ncbi:hypothetical protein DCAR_0417194 [Daucus carota subsp. sativus]|uniref:VQ domain-containing protein n=1 Tax=Daucus carota subsp. sativus TaxID=79200 RepID=A0A162ACJ7_DAUCS|nr:PREDICTED: VQ motif-containing protein 1-like [Daucus carota subsp. sativus]WOG97853.1 hypothetical protein DCAR_0417194 [Daucus carota subsp. sativus]
MSAAEGRNIGREPVRVVIVSTQYIETDPASFKSVVQSLTGKHSHDLPPPHPKRAVRRRFAPPSQSKVAPGCGEEGIGASGVAINDLDGLVVEELPSWNELSQLCII